MNRLNFWKNWSRVVKLTLVITTLIVIVITGVTWLSVYQEQQISRTELEQQAQQLLNVLITVSTKDSFDHLDTGFLIQVLQSMYAEQIIVSGRIYNRTGQVIADARNNSGANQEIDPLGQRLTANDVTIFEWQPDRLIAGQAVIAGGNRLGAVSLELPITSLQTEIATMRNQGLSLALIATIIGTLAALALSRSVTKPLQELVKATERIAAGDLTQPVTVPANDELAALGYALESMRIELQQLYHNLAQQVEALQASEARFRRVVTSIGDHIYMTEVTPAGERVNGYISPNVEELTGYPAETFLDDWSFWPTRVIYPDDQAAAAVQATRMAQGQNSEMEYRLIRADDNIIWVRDNGRIERDPVTQNLIVYGIVSDITERKHAEYLLSQARDQALEASRLKTQLLANVSHELRTPLNAILGYTEMLREGVYGPLLPRQYATTNEIIDSIGQLLNFVNNLLNQAQIDSGKIVLRTAPFVLSELTEAVKSTMGTLAKNKGIELICEISPDMPSPLYGDPYWLRQILTNLVGNAIKFTEQGEIRIQAYQADDTYWILQVADTGSGIPAEAQSYIFDTFRQVDGTATRLHGGSGLGLSIVNQLTTLMNGQITLTSEVGRGSVFTVSLPLKPIQEKIR